MNQFLTRIIANRYLPRWVVLAMDAFIVLTSFLLAYALRFNFAGRGIDVNTQNIQMGIVMLAYGAGFFIFRPFAGIIRHTTSHDIIRIFYALIVGGVILFILTTVARHVPIPSVLVIPYSVIIIHLVVTVSILIFSRLFIKFTYSMLLKIKSRSIPVMIYGAGELGQATLLALERNSSPAYDVIGFIDINKGMQGKRQSGIRIYGPKTAMHKIIPNNKVKELLIAVSPDHIVKGETDAILEYCLDNHIEIKKVPTVDKWINGTFTLKQIQSIEIEDLLGRDVISLNINKIQEGLRGKTILVTGAAGSIGSEIVRQLMAFNTGRVILLDQAESDLYNLQMELRSRYNGSRSCEIVVADISSKERMRSVFEKHKPSIIFNAAAYKHVPLMEDNPCEAVRVNIGGTKILADLSLEYGAEKFVMISTDKAVNPSSVMGATKRVSEIYIQSLQRKNNGGTSFITTRFGNVLGSNGSVVPLFYNQIKAGGPVTITHRDMKRYFMTITEACQLVLEAGFLGKGGEIFIFDMGKPVYIYDLAVKMITLAGLEPDKDIKIIETGTRPGEKLFEELLTRKEGHLPTHNSKIMIGKTNEYIHEKIADKITALIDAIYKENELSLVTRLTDIIGEYKPTNTNYSNTGMNTPEAEN